MRIGLMFGLFAALLARDTGISSGVVIWVCAFIGVLGGVALSSKLDAIARAADRD